MASRPLTLADVGTSAAAAVGVPGFRDLLGIGDVRHVVVLLVDGLGWEALDEHRALAPHLASLAGGPISAAFPTTTPVGLGALGTGLLAGEHGLVGASFEYPETGEILSPLHWGRVPTPVAVQPEATVFETVARSAIRMTTLAPSAYEHSGLTGAVLRGSTYVGSDDAGQRLAALRCILAEDAPSYTYVYWAELDRIGHEFGVWSQEWKAALARVDALVGGVVEALVPGSALIVTADHGMLDCPEASRICLDGDQRFQRGVRRWAGEPRARHVYALPGAAEDVLATWREILGDRADVLSRAEVMEQGLMGEVEPMLSERIGDVVAVARGDGMLTSTTDARVSQLLGQHGGLSSAEVLIPALIHRG